MTDAARADSDSEELHRTIGIIGAGTAGLITAHVLLKDGFTNVELVTRDASPGGVWAARRVYPDLAINKCVALFVGKIPKLRFRFSLFMPNSFPALSLRKPL